MVRKTRQYTNPFLKAITQFLPVAHSTQQKLQKAMELHRESQFDQAAKLYHQILEIDSGNVDALHLGGVVAHQLGNYIEAVRLIRSAIEINSKVVNFYTSLANSLKALNLLAEAVSSYDSTIALKPGFAEAYFYRGCILQDIGQLQSAADNYRIAAKHDPSFAEAYANLGLVLQELKEPKEAINCYERSIALKPDALWAGLPVLTKKGKALVARMATEALRGIEVPELITKTPEEYKELAIELAHNPDKLKLLKEKIQRNRLTTALFDPVANTRHIEDAYLGMYRRYQEDMAAEDFDIEAQNAN